MKKNVYMDHASIEGRFILMDPGEKTHEHGYLDAIIVQGERSISTLVDLDVLFAAVNEAKTLDEEKQKEEEERREADFRELVQRTEI